MFHHLLIHIVHRANTGRDMRSSSDRRCSSLNQESVFELCSLPECFVMGPTCCICGCEYMLG